MSSSSSCVLVKFCTKIPLRVAYCTWCGVLSFINYLSFYSAGKCRQRYSFFNVLTNKIFVLCTLC